MKEAWRDLSRDNDEGAFAADLQIEERKYNYRKCITWPTPTSRLNNNRDDLARIDHPEETIMSVKWLWFLQSIEPECRQGWLICRKSRSCKPSNIKFWTPYELSLSFLVILTTPRIFHQSEFRAIRTKILSKQLVTFHQPTEQDNYPHAEIPILTHQTPANITVVQRTFASYFNRPIILGCGCANRKASFS